MHLHLSPPETGGLGLSWVSCRSPDPRNSPGCEAYLFMPVAVVVVFLFVYVCVLGFFFFFF